MTIDSNRQSAKETNLKESIQGMMRQEEKRCCRRRRLRQI